MDASFVLILGVVAFVVGVVWYFSWRSRQKRMQALRALAANWGWTWVETDDSYVDAFAGAPFGVGSRCSARNVLAGPFRGRDIVTYDYKYEATTGGGDNQTTEAFRYTVWVIGLPAKLPALAVSPAGAFEGLESPNGSDRPGGCESTDLGIASKAFDSAFRVRCDDPAFGAAFLHPRMVELLLAYRVPAWRIDGDALISFEEELVEPEEIVVRLEMLADIVELVPALVWKDYGSGYDPGSRPSTRGGSQ